MKSYKKSAAAAQVDQTKAPLLPLGTTEGTQTPTHIPGDAAAVAVESGTTISTASQANNQLAFCAPGMLQKSLMLLLAGIITTTAE